MPPKKKPSAKKAPPKKAPAAKKDKAAVVEAAPDAQQTAGEQPAAASQQQDAKEMPPPSSSQPRAQSANGTASQQQQHQAGATPQNTFNTSLRLAAAVNAATDSDHLAIADASDANISGYLSRARDKTMKQVIAQEGGRGTKRRAELVTAGAHRVIDGGQLSTAFKAAAGGDEPKAEEDNQSQQQQQENASPTAAGAAADDAIDVDGAEDHGAEDDEWETFDLAGDEDESSKKAEAPIKTDGAQSLDVTHVKVEFEARPDNAANKDEADRRTTHAMLSEEERAMATARRKSIRHGNFVRSIAKVVIHISRGRMLYRQARHPGLLWQLIATRKEVADAFGGHGSPAAAEGKTASSKGKGETVGSKRKRGSEKQGDDKPSAPREKPKKILTSECPVGFSPLTLRRALTKAAKFAKESSDAPPKMSQQPCWITPKRDGCNNVTSAAVTTIIHAINACFELEMATPPNVADPAAPEVIDVNAEEAKQAEGEADAEAKAKSGPDACEALPKGLLKRTLRAARCKKTAEGVPMGPNEKVTLPSPFYFTAVFLSLAGAAGLRVRLVTAITTAEMVSYDAPAANNGSKNTSPTASGAAGAGSHPNKKEFIGIYGPKSEHPTNGGGRKSKKKSEDKAKASTGPTLPQSWVWAEVFCPIRGAFVSVNPCAGCTTAWNSPYVLAMQGDTVVEVTARYISGFAAVYPKRVEALKYGVPNAYLWRAALRREEPKTNEGEPIRYPGPMGHVDRLLAELQERDLTIATKAERARESNQLERLLYADKVPVTMAALKLHPLYIAESMLGKYQDVYPKGVANAVGNMKGTLVFNKASVVTLRTLDGWLRAGLTLTQPGVEPYKTVKPPPSRTLVGKPILLYGRWQTKPFEPLPMSESGDIPRHGTTNWYLMISKTTPPDPLVAILGCKGIQRVAGRMKVDFAYAVTAFEQREGVFNRGAMQVKGLRWEPVIEGIVVHKEKVESLRQAYREWLLLQVVQEVQRRRERAMRWWRVLIQRRVAEDRLRSQFASKKR